MAYAAFFAQKMPGGVPIVKLCRDKSMPMNLIGNFLFFWAKFGGETKFAFF